MKSRLLLPFLLITSFNLLAQNLSFQDSIVYKQKIEEGEVALKAQDYQKCLSLYKAAFQLKETDHLPKMRAALCAYQVKNNELSDKYLEEAFAIDWVYAKQTFYYYPEFTFLKDSPFEKSMRTKYIESAKQEGINVDLMLQLTDIKQSDQAHRKAMKRISQQYGWESPQMDSLGILMEHTDSINMQKISAIIAEHGYPGKSLVGKEQASTAFLVIQHSNLANQEKYLSLLKQAADAGEIRWRSVALVIDRINVGHGKKQIYGSQLTREVSTGKFYFFPIENPHKIDSIRATVGLRSMQKYADNWQLKWDAATHIEFHKQRSITEMEKK